MTGNRAPPSGGRGTQEKRYRQMKRDAIISAFIAIGMANLPIWQWRNSAEMLLMAGLFWQVAFVAVVGTGYKNKKRR